MERLTIYRDGALEINCENCPETKICKSAELTESDCLYFLTERLAEYEDAEEQGLSVKIPCKVKSHIWLIKWWKNAFEFTKQSPPIERCIQYFSIESDGVYAHLKDGSINIKYFGEFVFTSREAAEKALEDA